MVWEGPSTGASVSEELRFANLEALQTPYFLDFVEASSQRHDQLLTQYTAPLPSLQDGSATKNSKFLIMAWSFW